MTGRTISHYRITEKLGEGGMGVVYKADDTKLRRTVALKFLRADAIEDAEAKERFLREAQAAAGLDHPNICTVYEIDEVEGETFLAMAYIEGRTIKDKIRDRPLKLEEAIDIAVQTAEGLKAAHQKGVVHRDIKPANLMLTEEGQVKIMDFGLALLAEQSRLTKTSTILGTPAYMSPEQAERRPTDRRTDAWSLGAVIYEMVTGRLPFAGERQEAVLYAISNQDPEPVTALRAGLPMELEFIVGKALAKDPADRYQHVEEMIVDLRGLGKKLESGTARIPRRESTVRQAGMPATTRERIYLPALAALLILLLAVSFAYFREMSAELPRGTLRRFAFTPPVAVNAPISNRALAISPNGRHIAFSTERGDGDGKLWIQDLDQQQPRAIEGTEGAVSPFWSPDSKFIGFAAGNELKKVSVRGGLSIRLCEMRRTTVGGSWSPDGEMIVFGLSFSPALYEVPARAGAANVLISRGESVQSSGEPVQGRDPHFLPSEAGPRVLLFTVGRQTESTMVVQDLETGRREPLGPGHLPFYSRSGHVVYQSAPGTQQLSALPFSLETLQPTGEAFPIAQDSRYPTVAADGTLVYLDGLGSEKQHLAWFDRRGEKTGEIALEQEDIVDPALSPDGRRVAVSARENSNQDVWVYDIARAVKTRVSTAPEVEYRTVWSPTGEEVAFTSVRAGNWDIFLQQADGSGEAKVLLATPDPDWVSDWSRDGKYLLYERIDPENAADLWYLERKEDAGDWEPRAFLQTPFSERTAKLSPDGRLVAYSSNESGQYEVYVRPFPEGGRKATVSSNGGQQPRWSRDGKELFYVEGSTLLAVSVSTGPSFSVGSVTRLFEHPRLTTSSYPHYDVSADGRRFVIADPVGGIPELSIRVVENWYEEFRDRERE